MPDLETGPAVRRDALVVLGVLVALGVLGAVLWASLVTPAEFTKLAKGGGMGEGELAKQFDADAWYVVIAASAGLVAGLVLSWWRSRDPLLTTVLLVVGSALAAAVMTLLGHYVLGPGDPRAALEAAELGARVPERLDVDTFTVYLSWPVGVLVGAFVVLLGRAPVEQPGAAPSDTDASGTPNSGSRTTFAG
jgi:uncharacterized membrane protein YeaQ/YmgE (transglycosylase-associated protein family)